MGTGRHRAQPVAELPVIGHPVRRHAQDPRCQATDPHAGKQQEPVVADDAPDIGGAGVGGPSGPFVPCPQLPGRRAEADPAEDAVTLRADPVAHPAAGRTGPSPGMARRHHRLPGPAVGGGVHRIERDGADLFRRAGRPGIGNVFGGHDRSDGRIRHVAGRRKIEARMSCRRRQRLRRCRQARAAKGISPAGALARLAGQGVSRVVAGLQGTGKPVRRRRIEMAETDLHEGGMQEMDHLYRYGTLKGSDPSPAP